MKFSGVTTMIAMACETIFPSPTLTRMWSMSRFAPRATVETIKKRSPWYAKWPRSPRNVQSLFQV
jgi:hypothetical protein